jgi:hypothetical protein
LGGTAIAIRFVRVPAFIAFLDARMGWRGMDQDSGWPEFAELWPDPSDRGDGEENNTKLLFAYRNRDQGYR